MLVRSIFPIIGLMACIALLGAAQQKGIKYVPVKASSPASGPEMYTSTVPPVTVSMERATAQLPRH